MGLLEWCTGELPGSQYTPEEAEDLIAWEAGAGAAPTSAAAASHAESKAQHGAHL